MESDYTKQLHTLRDLIKVDEMPISNDFLHKQPGALTDSDRINIYVLDYRTRLVDAMENLFPCVRDLLGDLEFEGLAGRYLTQFPSAHFDLGRIGECFSRFLADDSSLPHSDLLSDVAVFEQAQHAVYQKGTGQAVAAQQVIAFLSGSGDHFCLRFQPHLTITTAARALAASYLENQNQLIAKNLVHLPLKPESAMHFLDRAGCYSVRPLRQEIAGFLRDLQEGVTLGCALEGLAASAPSVQLEVERLFQCLIENELIIGLD